MKHLFLILLLVLAACASEITDSPDDLQQKPSMIKEATEDYVKYNQDSSPGNMEAYEADCKQREGKFDECGPSCSKDAEFCVQVCTPTCYLTEQVDTDAQPMEAKQPAKATIEAKVQPTTHQIIIEDFKFKPKVLSIAKGDSVTWTNVGPSTHTATADGGTFDSLLLGSGQSWSYKFDDPGLFQYHCTPHRAMRASITVE